MKPLKVALIVKQSPSTRLRECRNMGYWSYPVDEFTWEHDTPAGGTINLNLYKDFDLVFQEDAGNYEISRTSNSPPLVFLAIDSTLSEPHFTSRLERARQADLVLVDHDDLARFQKTGKPTRRLNYCVNDMMFYPAGVKDIDVNFHCGAGEGRGIPGGKERNIIRAYLGGLCVESEWKYVSGGIGLDQYAEEMGRSKVVVNSPRTIMNRSHRIFDSLAAGCCLITEVFPARDVQLISGLHYLTFGTQPGLRDALEEVLPDKWERYAQEGKNFILAEHTWQTRAQELRLILAQELKI